MLDLQSHQGKFGQDYVRVLASAAGLLVYTYDLDRDGIDLGLRMPGLVEGTPSPGIEVQVKSISKPRGSAGEWHFDGLYEDQFNRLAGPDFTVPRYLFLMLVPRSPRSYVEFGSDGMLLKHLGYFHSFEHDSRIARPDKARRRTVRVSMGNVLTVRSLLRLVHKSLGSGA